ncbi:MAG: phage terminase small subunit P27 family [Paludibaculum sp.]
MVGRKPVPLDVKLASGNPGKRPLNRNEPIALGAIPDPPEWMSELQKSIWREGLEAAPKGQLKRVDASVFTAWVVATATHRTAAELVAKDGVLIPATEGSKNLMQHPALSIQNKQAELAMRAAAQLGFDPSSRSRLSVPDEDQMELGFDDDIFSGKPQLVANGS